MKYQRQIGLKKILVKSQTSLTRSLKNPKRKIDNPYSQKNKVLTWQCLKILLEEQKL